MPLEEYFRYYPKEGALPPSSPVRKSESESYNPEYKHIWDSNILLSDLTYKFKDYDSRAILVNCAEIVSAQESGRWQLGFKPRLTHLPDGDVAVEFPSNKELDFHTRYHHSVDTAYVAASLGKIIGLSQRELMLLATASLIHDYAHPVFSHVGEKLFRQVEDFARINDPKLYENIVTGLYGDHERRLLSLINDASFKDEPLANFLTKNFSYFDIQELKMTLAEKGTLGELLKLSDTISYLNLDSEYLGYKAPHFERNISDALKKGAKCLTFTDFYLGREAMQRFLAYRKFMYVYHYDDPFSRLVERLQQQALFEYLIDLKEGKTRAEKMRELLESPDEEILALMKRRTLVKQSVAGLIFFGIPYKNYTKVPSDTSKPDIQTQGLSIDVSREPKDKSIRIVHPGGVGYHVLAGGFEKPLRKVAPFLDTSRVIFYPPEDFFVSLAPALKRLCDMNGKMRPEEIAAFAKNPKAFQQRFSDRVFDLVSQPVSIKYRLSEVFK